MNYRRFDLLAEEIIMDAGINNAPIDIEKIANNFQIKLKKEKLAEGVSGVLIIDKNESIIGYDENDNEQRQRFTIAHEIGHYVLHKNTDQIFIDSLTVHFRGENSGEVIPEREANAFAAAILMPIKFIKLEMAKIQGNLPRDEYIEKLAERFNVSSVAMSYRLGNLNLL